MLCCAAWLDLVNVEAEVEKKYREKIQYKNISGLSKCTGGTGTGSGVQGSNLAFNQIITNKNSF